MSAVAEDIQTEMPAPILFTDSAAAKVADLIAEEGNPDLKLRVFVQGGGCSGFQYGFTFDEITNDDDTTMTKNGVSLLIDAMSYQYLVGAEIDYKEDLQGAQFVIKNPNATTTCGRVERTQNTGTSGARDALQAQRFAPDHLAGQPGKGGGFHLLCRQAVLVRACHPNFGQQRLQACHQMGVEGTATANNQPLTVKSIIPETVGTGSCRQFGQCGLHIHRRQPGKAAELLLQPIRTEQIASRAFRRRQSKKGRCQHAFEQISLHMASGCPGATRIKGQTAMT
ncbi:MAG: hypothetical protein RLZZ371_2803 [Pseudomonadota bacterium]